MDARGRSRRHGDDAPAGVEEAVEGADAQAARRHGQRHDQQHVAAGDRVEPMDVVQVGRAPQAEHGDHHAVGDGVHSEKVRELWRGDRLAYTAQVGGEGLGGTHVVVVAGGRIAHQGVDENGHQPGDNGHGANRGAPAHCLGHRRQWRRRRQVAGRPEGEKQRDGGGVAIAGHPAREHDQRAHEGDRPTRSHEDTADGEADRGLGGRKERRTDDGDGDEAGHGAARAEAVQGHADGDLDQGKGEEER